MFDPEVSIDETKDINASIATKYFTFMVCASKAISLTRFILNRNGHGS